MPLLLVHPSVDLTLELYVSPALEEAIAIQWERIRQRTVRDTYVKALEYRLQDALKDCLDWDLKPPTAAQVSYATLLATRHGISIPSEALKFRFHTAMFIETWARASSPRNQAGVTQEDISKNSCQTECLNNEVASSAHLDAVNSKAPQRKP